jgi:hypothetical protein
MKKTFGGQHDQNLERGITGSPERPALRDGYFREKNKEVSDIYVFPSVRYNKES